MATGPADKTYNLALLLPLCGLFLLMPPAVLAFDIETTIAGIPMIVVYIFAVWALLILGAALLARRLAAMSDTERPG